MNKKLMIISSSVVMLTILIVIFAFTAEGTGSKKQTRYSITGTWQLDSYKYGSSSGSFTAITPNRPHVKLITAERFLWVTYDTTSKKLLESAGGAYTLDGENYIEEIDFGYNMDTYLGSKSTFKIRVEDDIFYLSGTLSDGYKIEEVWTRIK